jgi:hypothetical protein
VILSSLRLNGGHSLASTVCTSIRHQQTDCFWLPRACMALQQVPSQTWGDCRRGLCGLADSLPKWP